MNNNTNFILAITLSVLILIGFNQFYTLPHKKALLEQGMADKILQAPSTPQAAATAAPAAPRPRAVVLKETPRIALANAKIHGSLNLRGARFDDITLNNYRETVAADSPQVVLLSPAGSAAPAQPYYAEFGWLAEDKTIKLPDSDTVWTSSDTTLTPGKPVTLHWDNGAGLYFERSIALDDAYMFTVSQKVVNNSTANVSLYPFALISRHGVPRTLGFSTLHEGMLGVLDGQLKEKNYKKLKEEPLTSFTSTGGWLGITDAYWLTSLIPSQQTSITAHFADGMVQGLDHYQADMQEAAQPLAAKGEITSTSHFFVGAKEVNLLDGYGKQYTIPMFDKAVDFGWFYFIAKPFFYLLVFFGDHIGNYGLAIIAFTLLLRASFYPLSESSYTSMARMKTLQPEVEKIRARYAGDPLKTNEEVAALYKREKLNPMGGCLPMLLQIPVFFALYKVLLVSIEMRHAPFYGWIHDLSAADPTNLFTLFGLLPFEPPVFLHLGALPLLMGLTMFAQQRMNPPPADKTTAQMFVFMPLIFTFLLAKMPAGLVIYWTLSNLIAILQQQLIKHRAAAKKLANS